MCLVSPVGRSRTACVLWPCVLWPCVLWPCVMWPVALCPVDLWPCVLWPCVLLPCGLWTCGLVSCGLVSCCLVACGLVSCGLVSCGLVSSSHPSSFSLQPDKLAESFQYFLQGLGVGKFCHPKQGSSFLDLREPLSETKIVTNKRLYQLLLNVNYSNLEYVLIVKQIVHCV